MVNDISGQRQELMGCPEILVYDAGEETSNYLDAVDNVSQPTSFTIVSVGKLPSEVG